MPLELHPNTSELELLSEKSPELKTPELEKISVLSLEAALAVLMESAAELVSLDVADVGSK